MNLIPRLWCLRLIIIERSQLNTSTWTATHPLKNGQMSLTCCPSHYSCENTLCDTSRGSSVYGSHYFVRIFPEMSMVLSCIIRVRFHRTETCFYQFLILLLKRSQYLICTPCFMIVNSWQNCFLFVSYSCQVDNLSEFLCIYMYIYSKVGRRLVLFEILGTNKY